MVLVGFVWPIWDRLCCWFWRHHCPTRGVFLSSLKKEQNKNFKKGNFVVVGVCRAVFVFWGSRVVVNLLVCCGLWIWAWFDCFKVIGFYVRALWSECIGIMLEEKGVVGECLLMQWLEAN